MITVQATSVIKTRVITNESFSIDIYPVVDDKQVFLFIEMHDEYAEIKTWIYVHTVGTLSSKRVRDEEHGKREMI